jgi:hypothetical protein
MELLLPSSRHSNSKINILGSNLSYADEFDSRCCSTHDVSKLSYTPTSEADALEGVQIHLAGVGEGTMNGREMDLSLDQRCLPLLLACICGADDPDYDGITPSDWAHIGLSGICSLGALDCRYGPSRLHTEPQRSATINVPR